MKEKWTLNQRINESELCIIHTFDTYKECFDALLDKKLDFAQFGCTEENTELGDTLESVMYLETYNDDGTIDCDQWCEPVRRTFEEYLEHKELLKLREMVASKKKKK